MNVSIIIPTYNVAPYIRKCLESVAAQTYTGSMECLVVDDCGQDNSIEIAENFIKEYRGNIDFRIVYREINGGLSAARNSGIREAKGDYLYFLDSDDWITPDCIQYMWVMVEKYPGVECVFAGANVIGSEEYKWLDYNKKVLPEFSDDRDWLQETMLKRFELSMTAWNRLISASFVKGNCLYFEEGYIHEDELWNFLISQVITKAAFVTSNTYNYIIRNNSITTSITGNTSKYFQRRFCLWNKMIDYIKNYRIGLQSYYIVIFASECVTKVSTISDYLKLMNVVIRSIVKSDRKYKVKLIHILLSWNKYYLHKILRNTSSNHLS